MKEFYTDPYTGEAMYRNVGDSVVRELTPDDKEAIKELLESQKVEPEAPKEEEEYLSPIEACEYLKVSKSTLARWRRSGYLTGNKVGGILRYKKS